MPPCARARRVLESAATASSVVSPAYSHGWLRLSWVAESKQASHGCIAGSWPAGGFAGKLIDRAVAGNRTERDYDDTAAGESADAASDPWAGQQNSHAESGPPAAAHAEEVAAEVAGVDASDAVAGAAVVAAATVAVAGSVGPAAAGSVSSRGLAMQFAPHEPHAQPSRRACFCQQEHQVAGSRRGIGPAKEHWTAVSLRRTRMVVDP